MQWRDEYRRFVVSGFAILVGVTGGFDYGAEGEECSIFLIDFAFQVTQIKWTIVNCNLRFIHWAKHQFLAALT